MTDGSSTPPRAPGVLARREGVALWRQIQQAIEREIAAGAHKPGARLPTEAELAARFAVNRHTVRRAMEELEGRGLIRITHPAVRVRHRRNADVPDGRCGWKWA
jgi:GntR family phosphonate transport system transcriptional regulator